MRQAEKCSLYLSQDSVADLARCRSDAWLHTEIRGQPGAQAARAVSYVVVTRGKMC